MQIVKLSKRGNSRGISIPKPYLDKLQWGVGDLLVLEVAGPWLYAKPLRELDHLNPKVKRDLEAPSHAETQV